MKKLKASLAKNQRQTLHKLRSTYRIQASKATLSRVLRSLGIPHRQMKKIPLLNAKQKKDRLAYAAAHCDPHFDWSNWIFSDEKKFNLDGPDGYHGYWHVVGLPPLVYSTNASSHKYVMVWGAISKSGQSPLVKVTERLNAKKYCDVLQQGLIPIYDDDDTFLHDRASCHRAKETAQWCTKKKIKAVLNAPKGADIHPIERAWSWMAHEVYFGKPTFESVVELENAIWQAWAKMPQEYINTIIDCLPGLMLRVVQEKGEFLVS
jgi:hypothetical protein